MQITKKSTKAVSEAKVPADLRKTLEPKTVMDLWKGLTPIARRDFISWIESAKQLETRQRRIDRVPDMLASGKRRPCCYALVPMNVYSALGANKKAKSMWSTLSPTEKRDTVSWIESVKDSDEREKRIAHVCSQLALGKRHL